jgi:small subunit ribosomal protein S5
MVYKKEEKEYEHKVIDVRRTARVTAGGRRFSFRVAVIIGNRNGEVGVGLGRGRDVAVAVDKAIKDATKRKVKLSFSKNRSILHETEAKFGSAVVILKPAKPGRGLVAGSSLRVVLDLAGFQDVVAKVLSKSRNKLNIARATISALKKLNRE